MGNWGHGITPVGVVILGLVLTLGVSSANNAYATVTSGSVDAGSAADDGEFKKVSPPIPGPGGSCPENSVGDDCQQTNDLWAFDEDQNIILEDPLSVDDIAGTGAPYTSDTLPVDTTVASHYVYFDPQGSETIEGCVQFDSDVVALIFLTDNLASSDFLANTGVNYLNPGLRGFELNQDSATFDGNEVCVDLTASTPGDYFRVLTEFSPAAAAVGGTSIPIDTVAVLLAGISSVSNYLITIFVIAAVAFGAIFFTKRR